MNIFSRLKARYTWKWIGTVEGPTNIIDDRVPGYDRHCFWNLYERGDGKRKVVRVGRWSHQALRIEAQVEAWQRGGHLPALVPEFKPKAARPALVLLQGGKGAN